MTKLIIKPQDRQSIDFAETERLKSLSSSGSLLHQEDIVNLANKELSNIPYDVEKMETLYDMSSDDLNLNWGYTNGICGGTSITRTGLFARYKKLKVYFLLVNACVGIVTIDLNRLGTSGSNCYMGSFCGLSPDKTDTAVAQAYVGSGKNTIWFETGFFSSSGVTLRSNESYFCYKIEGVN